MMNNFQKDVFIFVTSPKLNMEEEFDKYEVANLKLNFPENISYFKWAEASCFYIGVLYSRGKEIIKPSFSFDSENKIEEFLKSVFSNGVRRIALEAFPNDKNQLLGIKGLREKLNYRYLFICVHWGQGESNDKQVIERQKMLQEIYESSKKLKGEYPECIFRSLSKQCKCPYGFYDSDKIVIEQNWNTLAAKLGIEGVLPPEMNQETTIKPYIADETEVEKRLKKFQEPFTRLQVLAILCQGINTAKKAENNVLKQIKNSDVLNKQWWQCTDSEITKVFNLEFEDYKIADIINNGVLKTLREVLEGTIINLPDDFDFAVASNDLLRIKQRLYDLIKEVKK